MRLLARLYLSVQKIYKNSTVIKYDNSSNYAADLFHREMVTVLRDAIKNLTESTKEREFDEMVGLVSGQKIGLKINILNLLKSTAKYMIGYYLMMNLDDKSKSVVNILQVLKLFENEILDFGTLVMEKKSFCYPNVFCSYVESLFFNFRNCDREN